MKHEKKRNLLSEIHSLITDIESQNEIGAYEFLLKLLFDLQMQLNNEEKPDIQSNLSAIYRITTDDASFERSQIGQRLLQLIAIFQKDTF